jgi:2-iminobutanoate/2-iminopropanoate deaminase
LAGEYARATPAAGQVGMASDGRVPEDAAEQFGLALDNVLRNLRGSRDGGQRPGEADPLPRGADRPRPSPGDLRQRLGTRTPCITLVYVAGLATPALKVEVHALASAPGR